MIKWKERMGHKPKVRIVTAVEYKIWLYVFQWVKR
jgi:hypothetical protein